MKRHCGRPFRHGRAEQFGLGAHGRCWSFPGASSRRRLSAAREKPRLGGPAQRAGSPAHAASGLSARGSGTALPPPSACLPGIGGVSSRAGAHRSRAPREPGRCCAGSSRGPGKRAPGGGIPAWRWRVTAPASGALRGRQHPPGWVERARRCEPPVQPRRAARPRISRPGTPAGRITTSEAIVPSDSPAAARASTKPASSSSSTAARAADQPRPARAAAEADGALAGAHLGGRGRGVGGHYQQGASRRERALVRRTPRSAATGACPVPAPAGGHRSPQRICPRRARPIPADCRPAGSASRSLRAAAHRGRATAHHRRSGRYRGP